MTAAKARQVSYLRWERFGRTFAVKEGAAFKVGYFWREMFRVIAGEGPSWDAAFAKADASLEPGDAP